MHRLSAALIVAVALVGCVRSAPQEFVLAAKAPVRQPELNAAAELSREPLRSLRVRGLPLVSAFGAGQKFGAAEEAAFERLSTRRAVSWIVTELSTGAVVAQSKDADGLYYGASVTKIFVAAAALARHQGPVPRDELQMAAEMIAVSDNPSWKRLQKIVGQDAVQAFAEELGVKKSRVFDGWRGREHGNDVTAGDIALFLSATYREAYPHARTIWALMHAIRTGQTRGHAYLPPILVVGGKTGSWRSVRHHALAFESGGRAWGIVVLTENASEDDVARLVGGLYFRHVAAR